MDISRPLALLVLYIVCSPCQCADPWKTASVGRFQLTFFKSTKTFEEADTDCKSRSSRVVKVDEEEIATAIENEITTSKSIGYWIGATYNTTGLTWRWTDGDLVKMKGEMFNDWISSEPNNLETEHCVSTGFWYHAWLNVPCIRKFYHICQKAVCEPVINKITREGCSSNIQVQWKPHANGVGFPHRIEAKDQGSGENMTVTITPTSVAKNTTLLTGLTPFANYKITIIGCSDVAGGSPAAAVTKGIPVILVTATVHQTVLNNACRVTWTLPNSVSESQVDVYKITQIASFVYKSKRVDSSSVQVQYSNVTNGLSHTISTLPNRKYTIKVQAITCDRIGPEATASGICHTNISAPSIVSPPVTDHVNGNVSLSIAIPSDENGPVSCIIVILVVGGNQDLPEELSITKMNEFNQSDVNDMIYISNVMKYNSLNSSSTEMNVALGDEKTSECDIFELSSLKKKRKRSSPQRLLYVGNNRALQYDETYSAYVVTTTPVDREVVFGKSKKVVFKSNAKESNGTWIIPLVVAIVILLLLTVTIVILLLWRRRKKPNHPVDRIHLEAHDNGTNAIGLISESDTAPVPHITSRSLQIGNQNTRKTSAAANTRYKESGESRIQMQQFASKYKQMTANENMLFREQFEEIAALSKAAKGPTEIASKPAFKKKNRYKNILPYDQSRVVISKGDSGYINASFINGFHHDHKFIATQGPLPGTVEDFWQMVLDQECKVILMLAKCIEAGKKKCEKYWPEHGEKHKFGTVIVENMDESDVGAYFRRTLEVKSDNEVHDNSFTVHHYQFLKWPDHGIPITTSNLIRMHSASMAAQNYGGANSPIIVHCSAGAGRTGTFIGYDILLNESKDESSVDVKDCVLNMRKQRIEMVQSCDQYILLHKMVMESHLFGETDLDAFEVEGTFVESTRNRHENTSRFTTEFKNLSKVQPLNAKTSNGSYEGNKKMNGNQAIVPYDSTEVTLVRQRGEQSTPYINASWIEAYDESSPMIAAQGPMDSTVEYFWRAVMDNNVSTIVMLANQSDVEDGNCARYWPGRIGEKIEIGGIIVTLNKQEAKTGSILERTLGIERGNQSNIIRQYQYTGWKFNACPSDGSELVNLIKMVQENVRSQENKTTLIHCSDGAGRTGSFCAIVNLIERLKFENKVDVFRAVKDIRDCRPGMVQTMEQYIFCYRVIVDYLKSFDVYSNFRRD